MFVYICVYIAISHTRNQEHAQVTLVENTLLTLVDKLMISEHSNFAIAPYAFHGG